MKTNIHYTFGPVPSRRLGYSLGVDIIPMKTCNLNCVYCELGRSTQETMLRKEWIPAAPVIGEVRQAIHKTTRIDFITFSGSGEPTLNTALGEMISGIKKITDIPIAVLTNGTLLYEPEVRQDLLEADLVVPSLDAVSADVFRKVDRPHGHLHIENIVDGITAFRKEYSKPLWLEILLVRGINDNQDEIGRLIEATKKIQPDKVQLNTVVRPPAESDIFPLNSAQLEAIRMQFGSIAEVIAHFESDHQDLQTENIEDLIFDMVSRRPVTQDDISDSLGLSAEFVAETVVQLTRSGKIAARPFEGEVYYTLPRSISRNLSTGGAQ